MTELMFRSSRRRGSVRRPALGAALSRPTGEPRDLLWCRSPDERPAGSVVGTQPPGSAHIQSHGRQFSNASGQLQTDWRQTLTEPCPVLVLVLGHHSLPWRSRRAVPSPPPGRSEVMDTPEALLRRRRDVSSLNQQDIGNRDAGFMTRFRRGHVTQPTQSSFVAPRMSVLVQSLWFITL